MKKFISVALCLCMMLLAVPFSVSAEQATELVLENGVYTIDEYADFAAISDKTATYVLDKDIVINSVTTISKGLLPTGFTGVFDGNGKSITFSNSISTSVSCGIIAIDFAGTLKNITIGADGNPVKISTSANNCGIITNQTAGATTLENVTVYAEITNTKAGTMNLGLLFGKDNNTGLDTFINCHAYGKISVPNNEEEDTIKSQEAIGGFIGQLSVDDGTIRMINCTEGVELTDANIPGNGRKLGGFFGYTEKTESIYAFNCVSTDNAGHNDFINSGSTKYTLNKYDAPETLAGARIRYNTDTTGMRFDTKIDPAMVTKLENLYGETNVKMGTIICPMDYARQAGYTMTKDALDKLDYETTHLDVPYLSRTYETEGEGDSEYSIFSGAVANIKTANYGLEYIAVGYVSVEINGETIYIYSDIPMDDESNYAARTVKEVATAELAKLDENAADYQTKYDILNTFING